MLPVYGQLKEPITAKPGGIIQSNILINKHIDKHGMKLAYIWAMQNQAPMQKPTKASHAEYIFAIGSYGLLAGKYRTILHKELVKSPLMSNIHHTLNMKGDGCANYKGYLHMYDFKPCYGSNTLYYIYTKLKKTLFNL